MHYYFKSQVLKFIIRIQLMVLLCKQGPERTVTSTDQFACNTSSANAHALSSCVYHDGMTMLGRSDTVLFSNVKTDVNIE